MHHDTAELDHLLGDAQEKLGNPPDAVRELGSCSGNIH